MIQARDIICLKRIVFAILRNLKHCIDKIVMPCYIPHPSSIMHYDSFGNGNFRNPAILNLDGGLIKPNKEMSQSDIVTLNKLYSCENACGGKNGG